MIELKHLRAYIQVAEKQHFRRAAEALNTSQSAVSKLVANLEADIGAALLLRNTRRVTMTAAGQELLRVARDLVRLTDEGIKRVQSTAAGVRGRLSIGYMDIAIIGHLPRTVAEFQRAYPDVAVDLMYVWTDRQRAMLLNNELDIGFLHGEFHAEGVESLLFSRESFVAVVPASHRLAGKRRVDLIDLSNEPFVIGVSEEWRPLREQITSMCNKVGFQPKIVQEAHFRDAMFGFVAAGLGVTIYPEVAANAPRDGIKVLPLTKVTEKSETYATWKRAHSNPSLSHFLNFVRRFCKLRPRAVRRRG